VTYDIPDLNGDIPIETYLYGSLSCGTEVGTQYISVKKEPKILHKLRISVKKEPKILHELRISVKKEPKILHELRISVKKEPKILHELRIPLKEEPKILHREDGGFTSFVFP
jgi:hypothetical protein